MRLSVAMCTYNGGRTLREQLQSIADQTRLPDEMVVCDDASNDDTVQQLRDFIPNARFPVRLTVNAANVGSTANFANAIRLSDGDVIALSDQDDVWLPRKLELIEQKLLQNPEAGFVFSDAEMVDEQRVPLRYGLWEAIAFTRGAQRQVTRGRAFDYLLRRYMATGATLAFRSCYRDTILPIPDCWVHDAWIALVISAFASPVLIHDPLIEYRQHARQQIGEERRGLYGQYRFARSMGLRVFQREFETFSAAYDRLSGRLPRTVEPQKLAKLRHKVEHCRQRLAMRGRSRLQRLPRIAGELGRYRRYSLGWKSLAQDLFL
ncbi:MAG TPA: glycosyltransferase family 2 protein [Pirellulales bacterium]|nr:glycosyltransferase family 2 protein [Pirellulales bacterium]